MLPSMSPMLALTIVSIFILISNFLLAYINYKSSAHGDAATREQIMRERHKTMNNKQEIRSKRELILSEPRVIDFGFCDWVKSLLPGQDYPGYTHFNVIIRHTEWPDVLNAMNPEENHRLIFNYPSREELLENGKLQKMNITGIETIREPYADANGNILNPEIIYRIYVNSADPNSVELIFESFKDIIYEIEYDVERFELIEPVKTRAELENLGEIDDEPESPDDEDSEDNESEDESENEELDEIVERR